MMKMPFVCTDLTQVQNCLDLKRKAENWSNFLKTEEKSGGEAPKNAPGVNVQKTIDVIASKP